MLDFLRQEESIIYSRSCSFHTVRSSQNTRRFTSFPRNAPHIFLRILIFNTHNNFSLHTSKHLSISKFYSCMKHTLQEQMLKSRQTTVMITIAKSNPITGLYWPWGFQHVEAPRFQDSRHMKVVRLLALYTGHLYPPGNIPGTHFCQRLSWPQGHSAARRIMSMKNSSDTNGNRTYDLLACSTVPQPTAPPRALW